MSNLRFDGRLALAPLDEARRGAKFLVYPIAEGISANRGPSGKPRAYPGHIVDKIVSMLDGVPVHWRGIDLRTIGLSEADLEKLSVGVVHEDREPGKPTRKTPPHTRVGFLRNPRAELIEGVKTAVAELHIVDAARSVGDWLADKLEKGKRLMELSINAAGSFDESVREFAGKAADVVKDVWPVVSVDLVTRGARAGRIAALAEADMSDPKAVIVAVLARLAASYLPENFVETDQLDIDDLKARGAQAFVENIGTTLDAAGVGDTTGQRVAEVSKARIAFQSFAAGEDNDAMQYLREILWDSCAPSRPYGYAENDEPEEKPSTDPLATASEDVDGETVEPEQAPPRPAEEDLPMSATATTAAKPEAVAPLDEAAIEERRELNKDRVATMVGKAKLLPALAEDLTESMNDEIDAGRIFKRAEIQARIDRALKTQGALTQRGQVRIPNGVAYGFAEAKGSSSTPFERISCSWRATLGAKPEDYGLSKWPDGTQRIGMAEAYRLLSGDVNFDGNANLNALDESVSWVIRQGQRRKRGESYEGLDEAMSQASNFGEITADALNKSMQREYKGLEIPEREFVEEIEVDNLHSQKLIQVGGFAAPPARSEGNDYAEATAPADTQATATATDYGYYKAASYEMMRKDGAMELARWPRALAVAFMQGYRQSIWDAILNWVTSAVNDGTIYDSTALYTTAHANGATSALSTSAFDVGFVAMTNQTEQGSSRPGVMTPGFLVSSINNRVLGLQICGPNTNNEMPGTANRDSNPNGGIVRTIFAPLGYLHSDANFWALIADPNGGGSGLAATFLDGKKEPEILMADGPTNGLTLGSARQIKFVGSWYRSPATVANYRAFYAGGLASIS